jgi:hypothetical protein
MKYLAVILFFVIALLSLNSCKGSITNPTPTPSNSILMDAHFENQGQPSLSGLQYGYPIYGYRKTSLSFSDDVPASGGKWSLKVFPPDSLYSVMRFVVYSVQPSQSKQFRLTCQYKSTLNSDCIVVLEAWNGTNGYDNVPLNVDSATWTRDTSIFNSNNLKIDSLVVNIAMITPLNKADTSKFILFNEFKIEEYDAY